jgi:hypothetical protein
MRATAEPLLVDDDGHVEIFDRVCVGLGILRQEVADEEAQVFVELALASVAMVSKTMDDFLGHTEFLVTLAGSEDASCRTSFGWQTPSSSRCRPSPKIGGTAA